MLLYSNVDINWQEKTKFYEIKDFKIQRAVNSIISNAWPNQTYSLVLSYWQCREVARIHTTLLVYTSVWEKSPVFRSYFCDLPRIYVNFVTSSVIFKFN